MLAAGWPVPLKTCVKGANARVRLAGPKSGWCGSVPCQTMSGPVVALA